jgi:hypothetical protein
MMYFSFFYFYLLILAVFYLVLPWMLFRSTRPRPRHPIGVRLADALLTGSFTTSLTIFALFAYHLSSAGAAKILLYDALRFVAPLAFLATLLLALDHRRTAIALFTLCIAVPLQLYLPGFIFILG